MDADGTVNLPEGSFGTFFVFSRSRGTVQSAFFRRGKPSTSTAGSVRPEGIGHIPELMQQPTVLNGMSVGYRNPGLPQGSSVLLVTVGSNTSLPARNAPVLSIPGQASGITSPVFELTPSDFASNGEAFRKVGFNNSTVTYSYKVAAFRKYLSANNVVTYSLYGVTEPTNPVTNGGMVGGGIPSDW